MKKEDNAYMEELYKALHYSNEQFDKNVLFIASGALGISFAFIESVVPNLECSEYKSYLINSWFMFAFVIFLSLISHFISGLSLRWSVSNFTKKKFEKGMKKWNFVIRGLNLLMILGLLIGTLLLINFIRKNI